MQAISMRVILKAVFGLEEGFRYQEMARMLGSLLNQTEQSTNRKSSLFPNPTAGSRTVESMG